LLKNGLLELKSTAHKDLKKAMNEYVLEYSQDPTSLESDINNNAGVWFNISKEGKMMDTQYRVSVNQIKKKTSDGDVVKVDDRSPLSPNIVDNFVDQGYDLNALYARKTYDELKEILMLHLAAIAMEVPEAIFGEYSLSSSKPSLSSKQELDEEDDKPVAKAKPKLTIRLDDADEEDDEPVVVKKAVAAPIKGKSSSADIMAMADEILNK